MNPARIALGGAMLAVAACNGGIRAVPGLPRSAEPSSPQLPVGTCAYASGDLAVGATGSVCAGLEQSLASFGLFWVPASQGFANGMVIGCYLYSGDSTLKIYYVPGSEDSDPMQVAESDADQMCSQMEANGWTNGG